MKKYIITACIFTCFACNNNKKNEVATEANNTIENSVTLTAKQQVSIGIEVVKLSNSFTSVLTLKLLID